MTRFHQQRRAAKLARRRKRSQEKRKARNAQRNAETREEKAARLAAAARPGREGWKRKEAECQ